MRNVLVILLAIGIVFASGCSKPAEMPNSTKMGADAGNSNSTFVYTDAHDAAADTTDITDTVDAADDTTSGTTDTVEATDAAGTIPDTTDTTDNVNMEIINNPYFFKSSISQMKYKGMFLFDDIIEQDVLLNINELAALKEGRLFELKLGPIDGVPDDRLSLGYFYVQKDKIYKIEPAEENLDKLKTSEEIPDGSVIVCQDEEIKDALSEDEPGFHHYLDMSGDKREYHSYNNQVSSGYYESFTWEKGKGLINFRSGYGAERDSIELRLEND